MTEIDTLTSVLVTGLVQGHSRRDVWNIHVNTEELFYKDGLICDDTAVIHLL